MGTETWIISLPLSGVLYLKIIHPSNSVKRAKKFPCTQAAKRKIFREEQKLNQGQPASAFLSTALTAWEGGVAIREIILPLPDELPSILAKVYESSFLLSKNPLADRITFSGRDSPAA